MPGIGLGWRGAEREAVRDAVKGRGKDRRPGALRGELEPGCSGGWTVADEFDQAHDAAVAVGFEEEGFEALAQAAGVGRGCGVITQPGGHGQAAGSDEEDEFVADVLRFGAGVD